VKYYFGNHQFSSKDKVKKHAADIRNRTTPGDEITNADDIAFLSDLIKRHVNAKQKIGCGILAFYVDAAPNGFSTCFWLRRVNHTSTDFGVPSCLEDVGRINRASLRHLIKETVKKYAHSRLSGDVFVSDYSGREFPRDEAVVDHVTPFEQLVSVFFASKGVDVDLELLTESVDANEKPQWKDKELIADFLAFHNSHELRLVHWRENLSEIRKENR